MNPVRRSLIELNISALLLAMVPLFVKGIPLGPVSLIFWRSVFGALALGALLVIRRQLRPLEGRTEYVAALAVGLLMTVHWVTYFYSIKVSSVAVALTTIFTYPALTVLLEPLFHGERPRGVDLMLAVTALFGVALIVPDLNWGGGVLEGVVWGVFSALLFALRNVVYRRYLRRIGGGQIMLIQLVIVVLLLGVFIEPVGTASGRDWGLLLLLGVVFTATAHSLFVGSMQQLKAKTAGLIACLQPVYGIAAAVVVLGEIPSLRTLIGALIVMGVAAAEAVRAPQS